MAWVAQSLIFLLVACSPVASLKQLGGRIFWGTRGLSRPVKPATRTVIYSSPTDCEDEIGKVRSEIEGLRTALANLRQEPSSIQTPQPSDYAAFLESKATLELLSTFKRLVAFVSSSIGSEMENRKGDTKALLDSMGLPEAAQAAEEFWATSAKKQQKSKEEALSKAFVEQTSRLFKVANKKKTQELDNLRGSDGSIDAEKLKVALEEVTKQIDNAGQTAVSLRQKSNNKRGGFLADTFFGLLEVLVKDEKGVLTGNSGVPNQIGGQKAGVVAGLRIAFQEMEEGTDFSAVKEKELGLVTLPWSKKPIDLKILSEQEREHVWLWNEMLLVVFTDFFEKPEVVLGRGAALVLMFQAEDEDEMKMYEYRLEETMYETQINKGMNPQALGAPPKIKPITLMETCARKGIKVDGANGDEIYIRILESLSTTIFTNTATGLIGGSVGIALQIWAIVTLVGWLFSIFNGDGNSLDGDVAMTASDLASFSSNQSVDSPGLFSGGLELIQKSLRGSGGFGF